MGGRDADGFDTRRVGYRTFAYHPTIRYALIVIPLSRRRATNASVRTPSQLGTVSIGTFILSLQSVHWKRQEQSIGYLLKVKSDYHNPHRHIIKLILPVIMPINKGMMRELVKEYGEKKGKEVYYAMEQKRKEAKSKKK